MPLPLIAILLSAAAVFAIITISVLYWNNIVKWFESWNNNPNNLAETDRDDVGFTIIDKIKKGEYKTVQGVFNKRTNKVKDGRVVKSEKIDEHLSKTHGSEDLVIYE